MVYLCKIYCKWKLSTFAWISSSKITIGRSISKVKSKLHLFPFLNHGFILTSLQISQLTTSETVFLGRCILNSYLRERKKERERTYSLVYSPNADNSLIWVKPKTGDRNSIQVSHIGGRSPIIFAITTASQGPQNQKLNLGLKPRYSGVGCGLL